MGCRKRGKKENIRRKGEGREEGLEEELSKGNKKGTGEGRMGSGEQQRIIDGRESTFSLSPL
jgi:hypothetical protein